MWDLDHKEGWAPKNWCFWTVVLEKTLESPLDCKEIQPVNPKGNQSWIFIGRIDAETEALILWPPDAKSWLTGKDPDVGENWRQEEKKTTENEIVGWHHRLDGHEFEQPLGIGDGQGSLVCCSPWGCRESETTEWLNWTDDLSNSHVRIWELEQKKAKHQRTDVFKLWVWRRLLRVPWTARRSNQLILKEIRPEYSLEGLMLKLKLQYFGHLMRRTDSFEKPLMLGKIDGGKRRGRDGWIASLTQWTWVWASSGRWWWTRKPGVLQSMRLKKVR